ncbi:MAG: Low affinity potassium transport system protein kup [Gemmatimonadetes bacterium]|nr:Low affinity potassium transport system protein kup [Gemmatimonadota bacterium]
MADDVRFTQSVPAEVEAGHHSAPATGSRLALLTLAALGVVYGDIGTSPLYALRECFKPEYGIHPTADNILGVLSLILWSLLLVVSIKYIVFILRADNRGEGGILSLLALLLQQKRREDDKSKRILLVLLGLFGAALLIGEGIITPAISVLSAVEGLEVSSPALTPVVVPATVVILFALFMVQRYGTALVGGTFGPIMLTWFITIAALGTRAISMRPDVLYAINPVHGVRFFIAHGVAGFLTLGAVVLCITGCEALYADMGHFGKRPIRIAWFAAALPALMLNYFGQGALLLRDAGAATNPFYRLAPGSFQWPLLVIATAAAIVASQALISGAFSLTQQSIQLGYSPRMQIIHTSDRVAGQIYIPEVNKALMVGCLILVVTFKGSSALSAAYGIAVTGAMAITSVLFAVVAVGRWNWPRLQVGLLAGAFLIVDLSFCLANVVKVTHGGWVPLAIAISVFTLMTTWKRGRVQLGEIHQSNSLPLTDFLKSLDRNPPVRVKGTAVFMTSSIDGVPLVLLHHLKHNKVLHTTVVLLSVQTTGVPDVPAAQRLTLEPLGQGFFRVVATFGFMEVPNIPKVLALAARQGVPIPPMDTSYYLGRERLVLTGTAKMSHWRKILFAIMTRNARSATEFFQIPPNRVVELGAQIEF